MGRLDLEFDRLRPGDRTGLNEAAAVAARAFQFDPFFVHLNRRPLLRARGLGIFTRSMLASVCGLGEVHLGRAGDGRIVGVGGWVPPGAWPLPVAAQVRQGLGSLWALLPTPRGLVDGVRYLAAIEHVHPEEPVWYLNLLVADPSVQRSGVGTALLRSVLDREDAVGVPAYLETQNPDNLPYYGRFGFEVVDELRPVPGGPPLWTLRREARG